MATAVISTPQPLTVPRYAGLVAHVVEHFGRPEIEAAIELLIGVLDAMDAPTEGMEIDNEDGCYAEDLVGQWVDGMPGDPDDAEDTHDREHDFGDGSEPEEANRLSYFDTMRLPGERPIPQRVPRPIFRPESTVLDLTAHVRAGLIRPVTQ